MRYRNRQDARAEGNNRTRWTTIEESALKSAIRLLKKNGWDGKNIEAKARQISISVEALANRTAKFIGNRMDQLKRDGKDADLNSDDEEMEEEEDEDEDDEAIVIDEDDGEAIEMDEDHEGNMVMAGDEKEEIEMVGDEEEEEDEDEDEEEEESEMNEDEDDFEVRPNSS